MESLQVQAQCRKKLTKFRNISAVFAKFRDIRAVFAHPGHNRDSAPNFGSVPDNPGQLATMDMHTKLEEDNTPNLQAPRQHTIGEAVVGIDLALPPYYNPVGGMLSCDTR